jgi:hypothetical protein
MVAVEVVENQILRENQQAPVSFQGKQSEQFGEVNKKIGSSSGIRRENGTADFCFAGRGHQTYIRRICCLSSSLAKLKPKPQQFLRNRVKSTFDVAQEQFAKKDWKQAILSYQKYQGRKSKGKVNLALATLRIGV